ncbi:hypothetical protein EYF80_051991 [Liparis tanakae]|uniref:Uncharacterized protein n=1 Tax=Liparis tanakae TaxID=230148 RepID=A0A4Z2F9I0_9TELE|nr:hypothetical protein EYF80_051991 [Liparis tanakae]
MMLPGACVHPWTNRKALWAVSASADRKTMKQCMMGKAHGLLRPSAPPPRLLTRQRDEGLTLHPAGQQAVKHRRRVLTLEPGEQRHQLGGGRLCAQVLHAQHLQARRRDQKHIVKSLGEEK